MEVREVGPELVATRIGRWGGMKPFTIVHMMPSLDGRLRTNRWSVTEAAHAEYDRTADTYRPDAWLVGRTTMEEFANGRWKAPVKPHREKIPRTDWVAPKQGERYAVALDSAGKLAWQEATTEGDAVIVALSETVPNAYLACLRERGVSYLFAARRSGELDLRTAATKPREKRGIRRLLVEGGGKTTGAFLAAGLVDEISLLLAPVVDGRMDEPALFDTVGHSGPRALTKVRILSVRSARAGMFWLKARPMSRH